MLICAAQIESLSGEIEENVSRHLQLVDLAAKAGAACVVFPELSITGYEPKRAREFAISHLDARLDVFSERSLELGTTICIGVPTPAENGVRICMVIFHPDGTRTLYSKQTLHEDEIRYFEPGDAQVVFQLDEQVIVPAICYESLLPENGDNAATMGASIYLVSVAKPDRNVERAYSCFPELARRHSMLVVMCNAVGSADDFACAGSSAAWDGKGNLMGRAEKRSECLLIVDVAGNSAKVLSAGQCW